jgi:fatty-acid desaturase
VITCVADHRRHHKYSDKDGDPHSPWRFGNGWKALAKGLVYAQVSWMFDGDITSEEKFCPDWLADADIAKISRWFPGPVAVSLLAAALIGELWSLSWQGPLTAFFLAGQTGHKVRYFTAAITTIVPTAIPMGSAPSRCPCRQRSLADPLGLAGHPQTY